MDELTLLGQRIIDAAETAAPTVLQIASLGALQHLVYGALSLLSTLLGVMVGAYVWRQCKHVQYVEDRRLFRVAILFVCGPLVVILGGYAVERLANIYAWVGIHQPEVCLGYLALKALG